MPAENATAEGAGRSRNGQKKSITGLIGSFGGLGAFGDKVVNQIQVQQKTHIKQQQIEMAEKKRKKSKNPK